MSRDELSHLVKHIGQYISINSFLSTTMKEDVAKFYMGNGNIPDEFERIFFHIDACSNQKKTKPFANISRQSEFFNEFEVLFSLGSIFRLDTVDLHDEERLCRIHLTLCGEDEHHLKAIFNQMREQYQNEEINLKTLAKFLSKMGKFQLAEKYYLRLINQLSSNDPSLINLYEELDHIASQQGYFDQSLQWQHKLLLLKQQFIQKPSLNSELSQSSKVSEIVVKKLKKYPTGDVYDGEFVNGFYHGYGIYNWTNGDRYEGMWENNCREGQGTWIWGETIVLHRVIDIKVNGIMIKNMDMENIFRPMEIPTQDISKMINVMDLEFINQQMDKLLMFFTIMMI